MLFGHHKTDLKHLLSFPAPTPATIVSFRHKKFTLKSWKEMLKISFPVSSTRIHVICTRLHRYFFSKWNEAPIRDPIEVKKQTTIANEFASLREYILLYLHTHFESIEKSLFVRGWIRFPSQSYTWNTKTPRELESQRVLIWLNWKRRKKNSPGLFLIERLEKDFNEVRRIFFPQFLQRYV